LMGGEEKIMEVVLDDWGQGSTHGDIGK